MGRNGGPSPAVPRSSRLVASKGGRPSNRRFRASGPFNMPVSYFRFSWAVWRLFPEHRACTVFPRNVGIHSYHTGAKLYFPPAGGLLRYLLIGPPYDTCDRRISGAPLLSYGSESLFAYDYAIISRGYSIFCVCVLYAFTVRRFYFSLPRITKRPFFRGCAISTYRTNSSLLLYGYSICRADTLSFIVRALSFYRTAALFIAVLSLCGSSFIDIGRMIPIYNPAYPREFRFYTGRGID